MSSDLGRLRRLRASFALALALATGGGWVARAQTSPSAIAPSNVSQPSALIGASGGATPLTLLQNQLAGVRPPPFGAELFSSTSVTASTDIMNPGYVIKPGDHITLSAWGAIPDQTQDLVVDSKGNIVIPGAGPVQVTGLAASAVNGAVNKAASQVFNSSVHLYATPTTTLPITVLVTGPVKNPGPYQGSSTDSVVAFLQRAGGIDPGRGSYRNISVIEDGRTIARLDLYEFLLNGAFKPLRLHDGDVIVVGQQGTIVSVYGVARSAFTFELSRPIGDGEEILRYAQPRAETDNAGVLGVREAKPFNIYLPLSEFARLPLQDGDRVVFAADAKSDSVVVQVDGAHQGPASLVLPRQATVAQAMAQISIDPQADRRWIHLRRVSVAVAQKQLLNEALARLEKEIYTQPSATTEIAQANLSQAQTIQQYINMASAVTPEGDVALPPGTDLDQVTLEPDDTIVIPYKTQVVSIGGEVNEPQALIYQRGESAGAYVSRAGGFTRLADRGKVMVIHPDGTTQIGGMVSPGDRILVLVRIPGKSIELFKDLSQILYQIAIAAKAAGA